MSRPVGPKNSKHQANLGESPESHDELNNLLHCSKINTNESGLRKCVCCDTELPLSEFHRCGNGQIRGKCKKCCSVESQQRRLELRARDGYRPLESLPVEVVISETGSNWVTYLFNVMRSNGCFDQFEKDSKRMEVGDLLKRDNVIYELIGKEKGP